LLIKNNTLDLNEPEIILARGNQGADPKERKWNIRLEITKGRYYRMSGKVKSVSGYRVENFDRPLGNYGRR